MSHDSRVCIYETFPRDQHDPVTWLTQLALCLLSLSQACQGSRVQSRGWGLLSAISRRLPYPTRQNRLRRSTGPQLLPHQPSFPVKHNVLKTFKMLLPAALLP